MNIHELEKLVAAMPDTNRTARQVEQIMSLDMHKRDNFMRALEALKECCDKLAYAGGDSVEFVRLLKGLEEVK